MADSLYDVISSKAPHGGRHKITLFSRLLILYFSILQGLLDIVRPEFLAEVDGHDQFPNSTPYIKGKCVKRRGEGRGPVNKRLRPEPPQNVQEPQADALQVPVRETATTYVLVTRPEVAPQVQMDLVENVQPSPALDMTLPQVSPPEAPILPLSPIEHLVPGTPQYQV